MNRIIFFFILLLLPTASFADTIYLKTGRTIDTSTAWEKDDKVYFYLNGLKVSVPKSDVSYIESSQDNSSVEDGENGINKDHQVERVGRSDAENSERASDRVDDKFFLEKEINNEAEKDDTEGQSPEGGPGDQASQIVTLGKEGGFRGLKWGDRLSSIRGMVLVDTDTGLTDVYEYLRIGDNLKIEGVELRYIVYAFWRDRLYTITLWTRGHSKYTALRDLAFEVYGKGLKTDPERERYIWYGGSTDMMLEFIENGEHGMLWMRSRHVHSQFKLSGYRPAVSYTHWLKERSQNKEGDKADGHESPQKELSVQ